MAKALKPETAQAPKAGHNSGQITEEEFIKLVARFKAKQREIDTVMVNLKALKTEQNAIRNSAKALGVKKAIFDRVIRDTETSHVDLDRDIRMELQLRTWLALPTGVQGDLFDGVPEAAVEAVDFEQQGYTAGVTGTPGSPPEGVPPDRIQDWMRGWGRGQAKIAASMAPAGNA